MLYPTCKRLEGMMNPIKEFELEGAESPLVSITAQKNNHYPGG